MAPGFLDHASPTERVELVGGFAATAVAIVSTAAAAIVAAEVVRGLRLYLGSFDECNPSACVPCFFFFHASAIDLVHLNAMVAALPGDRPTWSG